MRITQRQRLEALHTGVAPKGCHFLVMATNTDGRVCAFGKAADQATAKRVADELWSKHGDNGCCYPGEERGLDQVEIVDAAPIGGR